MKITLILTFGYLVLVAISLFVAATIWSQQVSGVLYRCSDSVPVLDFMPPFVHTNTAKYGQTGDCYLVPESQVYSVWYRYVATCLLLPAAPILLVAGCYRIYVRQRKQAD